MIGDRHIIADSSGGFGSITVLVVLLVCAIAVFSLVGYAFSFAAKGDLRRGHWTRWLRVCAVMMTAAAICVYAWGALHVLFMEDVDKTHACMKVGGIRPQQIIGYEGHFLPLRFVCRIDGGHSYSAVVPGYVNPTVGVLICAALILLVVSHSSGGGERANGSKFSTKGSV